MQPASQNTPEQATLSITPALASGLHPGTYALQVVGSCLLPLFVEGEFALIEPVMPSEGDLAAIYIDGEELPLIKKLISFQPEWLAPQLRPDFAHKVVVEQLNPPTEFFIDADKIAQIHRVHGNYAHLSA